MATEIVDLKHPNELLARADGNTITPPGWPSHGPIGEIDWDGRIWALDGANRARVGRVDRSGVRLDGPKVELNHYTKIVYVDGDRIGQVRGEHDLRELVAVALVLAHKSRGEVGPSIAEFAARVGGALIGGATREAVKSVKRRSSRRRRSRQEPGDVFHDPVLVAKAEQQQWSSPDAAASEAGRSARLLVSLAAAEQGASSVDPVALHAAATDSATPDRAAVERLLAAAVFVRTNTLGEAVALLGDLEDAELTPEQDALRQDLAGEAFQRWLRGLTPDRRLRFVRASRDLHRLVKVAADALTVLGDPAADDGGTSEPVTTAIVHAARVSSALDGLRQLADEGAFELDEDEPAVAPILKSRALAHRTIGILRSSLQIHQQVEAGLTDDADVRDGLAAAAAPAFAAALRRNLDTVTKIFGATAELNARLQGSISFRDARQAIADMLDTSAGALEVIVEVRALQRAADLLDPDGARSLQDSTRTEEMLRTTERSRVMLLSEAIKIAEQLETNTT